MFENTMLGRAISTVVIVAMFWAGLWLIGKAPGPDLGRLTAIGQGAKEVTVGVAETAGEAAGGAVSGYEQAKQGDR